MGGLGSEGYEKERTHVLQGFIEFYDIFGFSIFIKLSLSLATRLIIFTYMERRTAAQQNNNATLANS